MRETREMPQTDFQIHELLFRALRSPFQSFENFQEQSQYFIDAFKEHEKDILKNIERFTGYSFVGERIPVYLVPASKVSISFSNAKSKLEEGLPGVVLKLFDETDTNLHIFIHELVHINQWQNHGLRKEDDDPLIFTSDGMINYPGRELEADLVTYYIIFEVFGEDSDVMKDLFRFFTETSEKNRKKHENLMRFKDEWDVRKQPLREYIAALPPERTLELE